MLCKLIIVGGDLSKKNGRFEKRKGKEVVNEDLEEFRRVRQEQIDKNRKEQAEKELRAEQENPNTREDNNAASDSSEHEIDEEMRAYDPKISCPSFSLGMSFSFAMKFLQAVAKYSIVNGHGMRLKKIS